MACRSLEKNTENDYTVSELDDSIAVAVIQLCARMSTLNTPVTMATTLSFRTSFHHPQQQE